MRSARASRHAKRRAPVHPPAPRRHARKHAHGSEVERGRIGVRLQQSGVREHVRVGREECESDRRAGRPEPGAAREPDRKAEHGADQDVRQARAHRDRTFPLGVIEQEGVGEGVLRALVPAFRNVRNRELERSQKPAGNAFRKRGVFGRERVVRVPFVDDRRTEIGVFVFRQRLPLGARHCEEGEQRGEEERADPLDRPRARSYGFDEHASSIAGLETGAAGSPPFPRAPDSRIDRSGYKRRARTGDLRYLRAR